jgi:hypothetical protein
MTEALEAILARYGREITISHEGATAAARAFLEPKTDRNESEPYEHTPLGTVDGRLWCCLCRTALRDGDTVVCGTHHFTVRGSVPVFLGAELSHWKAVLARAGEAGE